MLDTVPEELNLDKTDCHVRRQGGMDYVPWAGQGLWSLVHSSSVPRYKRTR